MSKKKTNAKLIDRAKLVGLSDEQIESAGTEENIKAVCDQVSPQTNDDAKVKPDIQPPAVAKPAAAVPETIELHKDDIRAEKEIIESFHRKLNIKYNGPKLTTITKVVKYDCVTKQVVSAMFGIE